MSKISLEPNDSGAGTFSIVSPDSNTNRTLNLPDEDGTILSSVSTNIPGSGIVGNISIDQLTANNLDISGNASVSGFLNGFNTIEIDHQFSVGTTNFLNLRRSNGAFAGFIAATMSRSGRSIANMYAFTRQFDKAPVINQLSGTGPFRGESFSIVSGAQSGSDFSFAVDTTDSRRIYIVVMVANEENPLQTSVLV